MLMELKMSFAFSAYGHQVPNVVEEDISTEKEMHHQINFYLKAEYEMFSSYETLTNNHMLMMLVSVMCTKFNGKKVSKKQCKKNMGTTSRPKIRRRCDKKLCKLRIYYYLYLHTFHSSDYFLFQGAP